MKPCLRVGTSTRQALVASCLVVCAAVFIGNGPALGAANIQGTIGNVLSLDAEVLGGVGCRAWSLQDFGINKNQIVTLPACLNNRCPRVYQLGGGFLEPGGYICPGENTVAYSNDDDNQTFYQLVDAELGSGACNHAGYYAVQGMIARNGLVVSPTGDFRSAGCPGVAPTNCFERADESDSRQTPLDHVYIGYGTNDPHQLRRIGGLSPIPTVRVTSPTNTVCPSGQSFLTWDNPEMYTSTMKNGVASPVLGVRLYKNERSCTSCPDGAKAWVAIGDFDATSGPTGTCVPVSTSTWFALTVRVLGPHAATVVETGRVGDMGFVGANSQCVAGDFTVQRIASASARYIGRRRVVFSFTTGFEGGVTGYFVSRGTSPDGPFERVSTEIMPQGDGAHYSFSERLAGGWGPAAYYMIEIVQSDGTIESFGSTMAVLPRARRTLNDTPDFH